VWDIPARLPYGGIVHSAGFLCNILETPVLVLFNIQGIVIPKRGIVARGICCFAAGGKPVKLASE
jgi:hypothetical protein